MKIVFNTKSLLKYNSPDEYFLQEVLKRIVLKYPEHEFIVITGHADANRYFFGKNVTTAITHQPVRHPLLRKLWFDFKLPVILKKYKADVFVGCDGFCSLATHIPQCLLLHDLTIFYNTSFINRSFRFFYKRYLHKFLHKAKTIATVPEFSKKDLCREFKIREDKIDVVYTAAKEIFLRVNESEREETKRKYSNEKNYFINTEVIHSHTSLKNLLKAFSVFKKRQQSNWKLLLTGPIDRKSKVFLESLKTYKYRDDVVLTGLVKDEDIVKLTGSSYAMICAGQWDRGGVAVLEALACHIPVITSPDPFIEEIAGDGVLYASPDDPTDMAEKMMLLYKDETLRSRLVEKGKAVVGNYSWDKTADLVWQSIQKAYSLPDHDPKMI